MQRKNGVFQKIAHFAENKGFYIVLGLCVVAIGVSGYVLFFTGGAASDPIALPEQETARGQSVTEPAPAPETEADADAEAGADREPAPEPASAAVPIAEQPLEQEPEPTVSVSRPIKAQTPDFSRPVKGKLQRPFSGAELAFDATMGDWRTHEGADYAAAAGDDVCAIGDGTVTAVFADPMKGNCVTLSHGDGLTSTYCGLQTNTTMHTGLELGRGAPVGKAGGEALFESAQETHLHLEVCRGGKPIDPESLFD